MFNITFTTNLIMKKARLKIRSYKGSKLAYNRGDCTKIAYFIFNVEWDMLFSNLNTQDRYAEFLKTTSL